MDDTLHFFSTTPRIAGHVDAKRLFCTTRPEEFKTFALWEDEESRVYAPRVELTEAENGAKTDINKSEPLVWFDCYIRRLSKADIEKGRIKGGPLEEGHRLRLHAKTKRRRGEDELDTFDAVVLESYWGEFYRTSMVEGVKDLNKPTASVGVVLLKVVNGPTDRSLLVENDRNLKRSAMPKAL